MEIKAVTSVTKYSEIMLSMKVREVEECRMRARPWMSHARNQP